MVGNANGRELEHFRALVPRNRSFGEAANVPCFALLTGTPPPGRCGLLIYKTRILPNSGAAGAYLQRCNAYFLGSAALMSVSTAAAADLDPW